MFLFATVLFLFLVYAFVLYLKWSRQRKRMLELTTKLPGPSGATIIEIALLVSQCNEIAQHYKLDSFVFAYAMTIGLTRAFMDKGITHFWLGFRPMIILFSPETVEPILTSQRVLNKAPLYRVFEPWMGEGLITSRRKKWQVRRKILTPAFHFRILNDFLPIINNEATKLVLKLSQAKYSDGSRVNIIPPVARCTMNTICETAMGKNQLSDCNGEDDEESPYSIALYEVAEAGLARVSRPWLWPDFVFYRTKFGRTFARARDSMHAISNEVIEERKRSWQEILEQSNADKLDRKITFEETMKLKYALKADKRMAFLDLLIYQHLIEKSMSLEDVREEVDTFMFAGHDTTAMNINWTLYMLGLHKDIQEKVRAEVDQVMGNLSNSNGLLLSDVTTENLRNLHYLEKVIKESLRMWPSVPFVARDLTEDVRVGQNGQYLLPKGSSCMIFTHALHHNPNYYPKPEVFDPERFSQEAIANRHPFAYVPFSAGPRNCIGQKYAQIEVKIILAKLIRNFYFESCEPLDKLTIVGELVLRPSSGLYVRMTRRAM